MDAWPWPEAEPNEHPAAALPAAGPPAGDRRSSRDPRRRRGVPAPAVATIAVLALLLGTLAGLLLAPRFGIETRADATPTSPGVPVASPGPSTLPSRSPSVPGSGLPGSGAADIAAIAAAALPSTVSIEVRLPDGTGATGSGFVLREDGYVLTNAHVVSPGAESGAETTVVFSDGSQARATIVGLTVDYDLAVLAVERTGLVPLVLGNSDDVVVGQTVVAVGAPLGLQGTVTAGIVSALNRPVQAGEQGQASFINAIQTDAAINPGNSGGPLLDAAGEVVGINSAIAQAAGQATGSIGLGFAIPSNQARRTAEQLIALGYATYPVIGVLLDSSYTGVGVRVAASAVNGTPPLTPDGPAARAGIEPGDVIVAIDGRPITSPDELIVAIRAHAPGDVVVLTVREAGGDRDVPVTLGEERSE